MPISLSQNVIPPYSSKDKSRARVYVRLGLVGLSLIDVLYPSKSFVGIDLTYCENLVDLIYSLDVKNAGIYHATKLTRVHQELEKQKACALVAMPDKITWLFNLRHADIDFNPISFGYTAVVTDNVLQLRDASCVYKAHYLNTNGFIATSGWTESFYRQQDERAVAEAIGLSYINLALAGRGAQGQRIAGEVPLRASLIQGRVAHDYLFYWFQQCSNRGA
ncbi:hypothetical protein EDB87DRAFT_1684612 [Lactarius vividus]|nr:hypothetical protein EDB87DRAFT_1684612 [Lactarius vividus]